ELLEFSLSSFPRQLSGDFSEALQNIAIVQAQKIVKLFCPVPHIHDLSCARLELGEVQILGDNQVEQFHLLLVEIIIRYVNVVFAYFGATPRREAHIRLGSIGTLSNDLGCSMS